VKGSDHSTALPGGLTDENDSDEILTDHRLWSCQGCKTGRSQILPRQQAKKKESGTPLTESEKETVNFAQTPEPFVLNLRTLQVMRGKGSPFFDLSQLINHPV
jgi:hypothetical protein